jgi:tetratricopeptide (TPR) repeat protein
VCPALRRSTSTSLPAALAALTFLAASGLSARAAADWEVRRSGTRDLTTRAERAFTERPGDLSLARRLVALVGRAGRAGLRARLCRDVEAPTASVDAVLGCASVTLALGDDEAAAPLFERAAAARPSLAALEGAAVTLARLGRRDDALARYDAARALARGAADERRLLDAELALFEVPGDAARELPLLERLGALSPADVTLVERRADALERLERPADAAAALEARLPSVRADERFGLALRAARLRDEAGDGERAAAIVADVLARLPREADERRRLAWERAVAVARHRDALPALSRELARAPGPVEWQFLGVVREELGDLEGALAATREAARACPSPELGRRVLGLLERLGRDDEIAPAYEAFARAAPRDPAWALALVDHELKRGHRRRAGEHLDAAAKRFARDRGALTSLAELASKWGDDQRALALWQRVFALAPRDERAIGGLADAQLATGQRALALRTWERLGALAGGRGDRRLRVVEALLDHDFVEEARARLPRLEGELARSTRARRLIAQLLEREGKLEEAERTWETVESLATGDARLSERREARAHVLGLLSRNRARLDARVRALADAVRRNPADRERALFLAEAQQRAGDETGAIATLRGVLERDGVSPAVSPDRETHPPDLRQPKGRAARVEGGAASGEAPEDSTVDVTFALAPLLRRRGAIAEAVSRLDEIARRYPARAREAHLLMADLGLANHDERAALAHAEEAARLAPGDGDALARIAAIEERAGHDADALRTYERAFALDGNTDAGLALAHRLARDGDADGASRVLHHVLRTSTDDDVLLEAGRAAVAVDEYAGRLPELANLVTSAAHASPRAATLHRLLAEILARLVPTLARTDDEASAALLARLSRTAAGPLLALVTEAGVEPDRLDVELLGRLANGDAAPVLARLASPRADVAREEGTETATPRVPRDAQLAAAIALARLADARGRAALADLVGAHDPQLRAAAVWGLGRIGDARDLPTLARALDDGSPEVAGFACLALGRTKSTAAVERLVRVAQDVARPVAVRRAALVGLARTGDRTSTPALVTLAASGDRGLEQAALLSLAAARAPGTLAFVASRAVVADSPVGERDAARALAFWSSGQPLGDEALAPGATLDLESALDLDARLGALARLRAPSSLWSPWAREIAQRLEDALVVGGARRDALLVALDARDDGLGLGALWSRADGAKTTEVAEAISLVGVRLRPRLVALREDSDPRIQALARRLVAKIDGSSQR